ncbi:MAG: ribonuclease HII [Candidatus Woesearchaeota archaeon]
MRIVGIDEAGRGPIIGPMVMCGVLIEEGQEKKLEALGVKDSKLLSPSARERIAKELVKKYKHHIVIISPIEIDSVVGNGKTKNLNWLEAEKAGEIVNVLKPDKVFIDCPSPNLKAYTSFIRERIDGKHEIVCEHKADAKYLVVGAASIIAKVTRDAEIEKLKAHLGIDFGSGYIADPKTKLFTEKYWNKHPEVFRHSWAPYKKLVQEIAGKQQKLDKF